MNRLHTTAAALMVLALADARLRAQPHPADTSLRRRR